ncbi:hypothetical protein K7432_001366 [Basidiobolus ranarum]|uniref:Uncharacterized protein n=1 Tax=Basidiobolus ranarum TaxID=34480 RepID=A0ABR2W9S8_9FUNG
MEKGVWFLIKALIILVACFQLSISYPLTDFKTSDVNRNEVQAPGSVMRKALLDENSSENDTRSELIVPLLSYISTGAGYIPLVGPVVSRLFGQAKPSDSSPSFQVEFPEQDIIKLIDSF